MIYEFINSKKAKFLIVGLVYAVALSLVLAGIFTAPEPIYERYTVYFLEFFFGPLTALLLKMIFDFLYIGFNKNVFRVFSIIFAVFHLVSPMSLAVTPLIVPGCACSAFSLVIYLIVKGVIYSLNIGFNGEKPMGFWRKLAEVFLQIALLPVTAVLWGYSMLCFCSILCIGGVSLSGKIIQLLFFCLIKREEKEDEYSYNVGASDKIVSEKVTHEVKDSDGYVIGTFDTTEQHVEHDSGDRYEMSEQEFSAWLYSLIIFPCKIISLIFSIFALFIPNLFVSAMRPKTKFTYNKTAFTLIDLIVFDRKDSTATEPTEVTE